MKDAYPPETATLHASSSAGHAVRPPKSPSAAPPSRPAPVNLVVHAEIASPRRLTLMKVFPAAFQPGNLVTRAESASH